MENREGRRKEYTSYKNRYAVNHSHMFVELLF